MQFTQMMCASLLAIVLGQSILAALMTAAALYKPRSSTMGHNSIISYPKERLDGRLLTLLQGFFSSGIKSDPAYSLSQILANGTFMGPFERKDTFEIQANLKNVTKSIAISKLLRSMNAFVTISNDPHPNKRWNSKDVLFYHSPKGNKLQKI
ncbi:uncharacterized protein PGTG_15278 [Puccinia graminis f. sp. tritici CRL 75-36-700-3]|uniref:DUF7872 domain-containing protein n=1 Tax=Puccinia graminis f. sp. tritici (strain CRL 75-36-700-3 / race SCCL) TaxID=418459 RepID=E3KYP0_PUCGT|nr:uncharacterized protein PGTG_15278 [Puccinia graminis f. sp. tritici CRL 75-36-700-3]EFP89436.2 hypothetical protein PGTG_15278 [Puccinia graminis f. sp. tritici CRL 75-36-700-3]